MAIGARETSGWKATIAVAMSNYIEAGSIIAIAVSLTLWQEEFGLDDFAVGLLAALSANAFGAAAGALVGGWLCDRFGRKFIYTYDLLVYMVGVLLAVFAFSYGMLLAAFVITGLAVGAGVPASWTFIAEEAPPEGRARHVGTAQLAWSIGPMVGFALAIAVVPLGLLGSRLIFAHLFVVAFITWWMRQGLSESKAWTDDQAETQEQPSMVHGVRELLSVRANVTRAAVLLRRLRLLEPGRRPGRHLHAAGVRRGRARQPVGTERAPGPRVGLHGSLDGVRCSCASETGCRGARST